MSFTTILTEFGKKENAFAIKAERDNNVDPKETIDSKSYSYYVRIFLVINPGFDELINYIYNDISMVAYELPIGFNDRIRMARASYNQFEIRIWTPGFFQIQATLYPKFAPSYSINGKITFNVTDEEKKLNSILKKSQNPLEI